MPPRDPQGLDPARPTSKTGTAAAIKVLVAAMLRGSWFALLLGMLAGALGVAAFFAFDRTGAAAVQALERALAEGALPSVTITRPGGVDDRALASALAAVEPIARALLSRQFGVVRVSLAVGSEAAEIEGQPGQQVLLVGVELAKEAMARPGRTRGLRGARSALQRGGLLLDRTTAAALGVGLGAVVSLRAGDRSVDATVAAIVDELGPDTAVSGVAIAELDASRRLLGRASVDEVEVLLAPDKDPVAVTNLLRTRIDTSYRVTPSNRRVPAAESIAAMRNTWTLASWLALAVGAIALLAALRDQVQARRRGAELLHALGAAPWFLRCYLAAPAVVVAVVAAGVGAIAGSALSSALSPGIAAWVKVQTGVGIAVEFPAMTWPAWGALLVGAIVLGWLASFARSGVAGLSRSDAGVRAFAPGRLLLAVLALGGMTVITFSGLLLQHAAFRALDLLLGVLVAAWLAPPVALLLARLLLRGFGDRASVVLTAGRFAVDPGGLLGVIRLGAVGGAVVIALASVAESLLRGAPELIAAAVPAGSTTVPLAQVLGLEADVATDAAADAIAEPAVGQVVISGELRRARLLAVAARAIDTVFVMNGVLMLLTGLGVVMLLWLDIRRRQSATALLSALGASGWQRARSQALIGAVVGCAMAVATVMAGVPIGLVWTRGALHQSLGWDCDYVVPPLVAFWVVALPVATASVSATFAARPCSR